MENNLLEVGKIINTHGLRGDVKVAVWMDYPEYFEEISYVYIKTRTELKKLTVKNVKYQKNNLIVKFDEFKDINEAEPYKNFVLYADRDELGELTLSGLMFLMKKAKNSVLLQMFSIPVQAIYMT